MAPAPLDNLSPAGSSTYSSNTMYVGDGTWDSTKNTFLLPNLQSLNLETTQYNGMGNRFSSLEQYHTLILGHAILGTITFLLLLPTSIMVARFFGRVPGRGVQIHIYLNILVVGLTTVVFILGWFAVGPSRSLTNPHHGIGLAIYVLILVQAIGGHWMRGREIKNRPRRPTIKLMLHQWLGRAIALLGIVQVALGLTLYGSPKFTFILYTLWMTFLLVLYFILSYRAGGTSEIVRYSSTRHGGTIISERKTSGGGFTKYLAPLAAGGALAALLGRNRNKEQTKERVEVIPSRHGSRRDSRRDSGSFFEEEKHEERKKSSGMMGKILAGAAVLGGGALIKSWMDGRKRKKEEEEYTSVAPDTPSRRRQRRDDYSDYTESTMDIQRSDVRRPSGLLPGPGDPVATAAAMSAAEPRPVTPRPVRATDGRSRRDSYSSYNSESPSRRTEKGHGVRNGLLAGLGLGWLGSKFKNRRDRQEQQRLDEIRDREMEDERRLEEARRRGGAPPRFTGDGIPPSRSHGRRPTTAETALSSEMTSHIDSRPTGMMPPLAAGVLPSSAASVSRSRYDINEPVSMPAGPPRDPGYAHELGSESYITGSGRNPTRNSSQRRREAEAAAATAGASLAAAEQDRRRRDHSQGGYRSGGVDSAPAASLKVKMHGDSNKNVTLRRLTEEEAAAEREARRRARKQRADSASDLSGTDTAQSRRYRRREAAETGAERRAESGLTPLSPPRPAFAGGRQPKDSAYYSGGQAGGQSVPESVGSHGTWSAMSPTSGGGGDEDHNERRRRRRMERNQRQTSTVEFE